MPIFTWKYVHVPYNLRKYTLSPELPGNSLIFLSARLWLPQPLSVSVIIYIVEVTGPFN
jgi:hypothetical protein